LEPVFEAEPFCVAELLDPSLDDVDDPDAARFEVPFFEPELFDDAPRPPARAFDEVVLGDRAMLASSLICLQLRAEEIGARRQTRDGAAVHCLVDAGRASVHRSAHP